MSKGINGYFVENAVINSIEIKPIAPYRGLRVEISFSTDDCRPRLEVIDYDGSEAHRVFSLLNYIMTFAHAKSINDLPGHAVRIAYKNWDDGSHDTVKVIGNINSDHWYWIEDKKNHLWDNYSNEDILRAVAPSN